MAETARNTCPGRSADFVLRRVREIEREHGCAVRHARHVTALALELFDQLRGVHGLGERERLLLECAGLLHDIGWSRGRSGHHKESMRMILSAGELGLTRREQLIVANAARYHRKALPAERHASYRRLAREDRALVQALGGMLRLADGLDCRHLCRVRAVEAAFTAQNLTVTCQATGDAGPEQRVARMKSDLLAAATGRAVKLKWGRAGAGARNSTPCSAAPALTRF